MRTIKLAAFAIAFSAIGSVNAAVINFQTGYSEAGSQASAAAYRSVVESAIGASSYGSKQLLSHDIVSNQSLFGASASNIAFKSTILFGVSTAGSYAFRAGVDFGGGGAVFLDGKAVALNQNDMWWTHDYVNTNSVFQVGPTLLAAGNHQLTVYGLEGCCDGGQQVQYAANGGVFQSFSAQTLAPAPEPGISGMMLGGLGGLGVIGALARRRRQRA